MSSTILLSDNGATSGISGYQLTGGTDGTLTIQTTTSGGTPTTAVTISDAQVVALTNALPVTSGGTGATSTAAALSSLGAQATLVSGTNIKTVNSTTLLGSGNLAVQETLVSGTNIKTINSTSLLGSGNISITSSPGGSNTQVQYNSSGSFAGSSNLTFDGTNLTCGGTVTANSDESLKANWRDLPADFVEQLAKVKHGTYDRVDLQLTQDGVSAQSLQPLMPNSVLQGEDGKLSVAYGNAALVAAIALAQRVVQLEAVVSKLAQQANKT